MEKIRIKAMNIIKFILLFFLLNTFAFANAIEHKRILIVQSYSTLNPWTKEAFAAFQKTMADSNIDVKCDILPFSVQFSPDVAPSEHDIQQLQIMLNSIKYDLVIADSNPAARLFLNRNVIIPNKTPLIIDNYYGEVNPKIQKELNMTMLSSTATLEKNVDLLLQLLPDVENIVAIYGSELIDFVRAKKSDKSDIIHGKKIDFIDGNSHSTEELLEKVSNLTSKDAVLFFSWASIKDADVRVYRVDMLQKIANSFSGIVLGDYSTYLNNGSNGGVLIDATRHGVQLAQVAELILKDYKDASQIPYTHSQVSTVLDYSVIDKFGIAPKNIPQEAALIHLGEENKFEKYFSEIMIILGIIIFLSLIILFQISRTKINKKQIALFANLPLRIFIFDCHGNLIYSQIPDANQQGTKDLTNIHGFEKTVNSKYYTYFKKTLETGKKSSFEFYIDDQYRKAVFSRLPNKKPFSSEAVMVLSYDITERKLQMLKIQEELQLRNAIIDNLPCVFFIKNITDGKYILCNQAYASTIGASKEEIIGKSDREISAYTPELSAYFEEMNKKVVDLNAPLNIIEEFKGKYFRSTKALVQLFGAKQSILNMSIDVTREYQLEQEQKVLLESLHIANKSERFINQVLTPIITETDFDKIFVNILEKAGIFLEADRVLFMRFYDEEHPTIFNVREWHSGKASPARHLSMVPTIEKAIFSGRDIKISDSNNPPLEFAEDAAYLRLHSIKSLLMIGVRDKSRLIGILAIEYVVEQRNVDIESSDVVRNVANLCMLAYERQLHVERISLFVTQQKQIMDNISIPIVMVDTNFMSCSENSSVRHVMKITHNELATKTLLEILNISSRQLETGEFTLAWKNRYYIINKQPLYDVHGDLSNILFSFIDITEIRRKNEELQIAMEKTIAANSAKSYFFATMNHELRTPLNAVIGFSELLQDDNIQKEKRLEYLRSINYAGISLLNLINDVLNLSKLESGNTPATLAKVNLFELLEELRSIFSYEAKKKGLKLVISNASAELLYLDQLRIRQILLNLIGNAIKFTHEGSIIITANFIPEKEGAAYGYLRIHVKDTGPGIPKDKIKHLFEPFFQITNAARGARAYEGTGLGLPISQRLAESMGGIIEATSSRGEGADFTLCLNHVACVRDAELIVDIPEIELKGEMPSRVLVVDDISMNLKILQAMLKKLDIQSVCADSAQKALEILETDQNFDAILSDLWMPEMNGEELCDKIKENPALSQMKFVIITADTEISDDFSVEKFDMILNKPITLAALQQMKF